MLFFVVAYALAFLLWRAEAGRQPWILVYVSVVVSVWLLLYLRWRMSQPPLPRLPEDRGKPC